MRARISLLKYLNSLLTPLLHYVDVTVYENEERFYNSPIVTRSLCLSVSVLDVCSGLGCCVFRC